MTDQDHVAEQSGNPRIRLWELAQTFATLGLIGFGGPAVHIALMERELVARRRWLSHEHFLNLLAAVNLVPGPNSTEMAFHIGQVTRGLWGSIVSGLGFVLPAVIISTLLAVIYVAYGALPAAQGILLGVKPVVLVVILSAAYRLGLKAIDTPVMRALFGLALVAVAFGVVPFMGLFGLEPVDISELAVLSVTGILHVIYRRRSGASSAFVILAPLLGTLAQVTTMLKPTLLDLFGRFLIIGATLFGTGYVLVAYMEGAFVTDAGWLTRQQLVDVIAIGQATPGPLTSSAGAAGYVMAATPDNLWAGIPAAVISSVAVFLPAFFIVLILGRVIPLMQRYPAALDFLKGVNAGVIALLIGAFINLAWGTLVRADSTVDWLSVMLTLLAFFALERLKWTPLGLVVLGAAIGLARTALGLL